MEAKKNTVSLRPTLGRFDEDSVAERNVMLRDLAQRHFPLNGKLKALHDDLLFICAYPANEEERILALQLLERITEQLRSKTGVQKNRLADSGMPFTSTTTSFSYDLLKWAETSMPGNLSFESFDNEVSVPLFLKHTLPPVISEILTEDGMNGNRLLRTLFGKKKNYLRAILAEASRLDHCPALRDQLFDATQMNVKFISRDAGDSLTYNRIESDSIFYHHDLIRKIDHREWLDKKLPSPRKLNAEQKGKIKRAIRMSLLLLGRETEPSTWMDEDSIRMFDLERGISVCIYGMTKDHRQPLESYFGFTAFKNGYPMSYGGAWLFGKRALFGMNIFEWFRGGESALVFAQLLRTYRQFFGIEYFEVEPYQYGKDNPEGIQSGAFWFYHRFGFRLLDKKLHELSEEEAKRVSNEKGYRTPPDVLRKFTHSNIGLKLGAGTIPLAPSDIRRTIAKFVAEKFSGDYVVAEKSVTREFSRLTGLKMKTADEKRVFADLTFLILSGDQFVYLLKKKNGLKRLILLKNSDEAAYQNLLRTILK